MEQDRWEQDREAAVERAGWEAVARVKAAAEWAAWGWAPGAIVFVPVAARQFLISAAFPASRSNALIAARR